MDYLHGWLEVIVTVLIFVAYISSYYLYGLAFAKICRKQEHSQMFYLISGFFIYQLVFFVAVLPMKAKVVPLNIIAYVWAAVWIITIGIIAIKWRRDIKESLVDWKDKIYSHKMNFWGFTGITAVQIIFEELYGRYTCGFGAAYFNGYVSSSLFTNQLGTVNPWTGAGWDTFSTTYFLQTYNDHSAVISYLTKLSPLIETRTIMSTIVIIIGNMIIYELAKAVFQKKPQYRMLFFVIYTVVAGFWVPCVYNPAYYYYFRSFEGKTVFGTLLIPLVILCIWKLYGKPSDRHTQWVMVVSLLGSYTFCMSTMYILPFIFISYMPMIFVNRKTFKNLCLGLVPCILVILYYVLVMKGVFSLSIK